VTETRIASGIRAIRQGETTLLVTTSAALLAACDRVVIIAGGVITRDGTHAELLDDDAYQGVVLA
jgi:putative ABC transport system ATP-binding protein